VSLDHREIARAFMENLDTVRLLAPWPDDGESSLETRAAFLSPRMALRGTPENARFE
jgi:hypothetical protein